MNLQAFREIVDRTRMSTGGVVDQGHRVVGEQRIGAAGDLGVMADVVGGVSWTHAGQGVAHGDALIQRGKDTEA